MVGRYAVHIVDDPKWFSHPEHDHMQSLDNQLAAVLREEFDLPDLQVDCGYEERVGYHFRIYGVIPQLLGKVSDRARDWLASASPFRFEIQVKEPL